MRDADLFRDERDADTLIDVVTTELARRWSALDASDERLMDWLSRDARRRPPVSGDWDPQRVRRLRRRILDRALAEQFGVRDTASPETLDMPPSPLVTSVDEAARGACAAWMRLAAAAGSGRELWEEECDRWIVLPRDVPPGRYLALQVTGDSMVPLFRAGDSILVRLGPEAHRDTIVVARRGDDGYVVKRVGRLGARTVELLSLNPAYAPVTVSRDERTILGTVLMRWRTEDGEIEGVRR